MRYKFSTLSGSEYLIDTIKMTWKRRNANAGHEGLIPINEGFLLRFAPHVQIGRRAYLYFGVGPNDYIHTTHVDRIEALDYPEDN